MNLDHQLMMVPMENNNRSQLNPPFILAELPNIHQIIHKYFSRKITLQSNDQNDAIKYKELLIQNLPFSSKEFIVFETYHPELHAMSITAIDKKQFMVISQSFISLFQLQYYELLVFEFIISLQHKSLIYVNFASFYDIKNLQIRAKALFDKFYENNQSNIIFTFQKMLKLDGDQYIQGNYQDINFTSLLYGQVDRKIFETTQFPQLILEAFHVKQVHEQQIKFVEDAIKQSKLQNEYIAENRHISKLILNEIMTNVINQAYLNEMIPISNVGELQKNLKKKIKAIKKLLIRKNKFKESSINKVSLSMEDIRKTIENDFSWFQDSQNCHFPELIRNCIICKVCRKENSKRKTKYRCKGCIEMFQRNVNLCVTPCFEKFHLNPAKYLFRKQKNHENK